MSPVKSQEASDEDKDTGSQPENRSRRLSTVDLELVVPAATCLDRLRTIASPCLPKSVQPVGLLAMSDRNTSYKDEFALIHVHRVSFYAHTPQDA